MKQVYTFFQCAISKDNNCCYYMGTCTGSLILSNWPVSSLILSLLLGNGLPTTKMIMFTNFNYANQINQSQ